MENVKFIRDSLYGNIKIDGVFLQLMESPEIQRLSGIKQLGLTYLVYPGANHTRLEHSLGTSYMARKIATALDFNETIAGVAALLHDIGHGPFSHTLEYLQHRRMGKSHVDITKEMILGHLFLPDYEYGITIKDILSDYGIEARKIVDMIEGKTSKIVNGALDADQMDYLMRDAYYTGVAYGVIDSDRIIQTMKLHDDEIVFEKKGISALESMLVARALMYSSVYLHKTVRIAELMLVKAVELAEPFDFWYMNDGELMEKLKSMGGYQKEIALRLKYRKLFKKAISINLFELNEKQREAIEEMDIKEMEMKISNKIGREGYVIIDMPGKDILLSEPRLKKMDIKIIDGDKIIPLHECTPIAHAIKAREITEWSIMVCTPEKYRAEVKKYAEKMIFGG
ncbi:MAG: HD domain-containing protein [Thermoplasmata archaeon]|nr:MAG: HD domain-containing protein [Thermoplasmata archaeon]